jgi:hypothetical protein
MIKKVYNKIFHTSTDESIKAIHMIGDSKITLQANEIAKTCLRLVLLQSEYWFALGKIALKAITLH